jgi:hypothetical protein
MAPDGGQLTKYALSVSSLRDLTDLEVVFRLSPYQKAGADRAYLSGSFYRKLSARGQRDFVFYSGQNARLDIFAKGLLGQTPVLAQTMVSTFGQSGLSDPEAIPLKFDLNWPSWRLKGSERFYRAQTGQPLALTWPGKTLLAQAVQDGVVMANFPGSTKGSYRYAVAHDQNLAQKSYVESPRDLVFVAYLDQGQGQATFSLPVYRAYYGQLAYSKGLGALAVVVLGGLGLVGLRGRRFRVP